MDGEMVLTEVAEQLLRSLALLLLFSPDDAASIRRLSPLHTAQVKGWCDEEERRAVAPQKGSSCSFTRITLAAR